MALVLPFIIVRVKRRGTERGLILVFSAPAKSILTSMSVSAY